MTKGGLKDWPDVVHAGKRAIAQMIDGERVERRLQLAGYMPGEDEAFPLFNLATNDGEFIDWAELQGWTLN